MCRKITTSEIISFLVFFSTGYFIIFWFFKVVDHGIVTIGLVNDTDIETCNLS